MAQQSPVLNGYKSHHFAQLLFDSLPIINLDEDPDGSGWWWDGDNDDWSVVMQGPL